NKATALARAELAKQIEVKVKAMDKTYQRLTDTAEGSTTGGTFESVSKQLANKTLSGSRVTKIDYVDFPDDTQKLCVMVTMSPELTESLFKDLLQGSGKSISPKN
ncbi:LPP20 family lipoprotein, partial [Oleiphilus sp. HI0123]